MNLPLAEVQRVIVYRSQTEMAADQFWSDNPWIALVFVGVILLFIAFCGITILVGWYKMWKSTRRR